MSEAVPLRQVWAVVYDGDPRMDGGHERRQASAELRSPEEARRLMRIMSQRGRPPREGLRIETRWVSEWTVAEL